MAIKTVNGRDINNRPTVNENLSKSVLGLESDSKSFFVSKSDSESNSNIEKSIKYSTEVEEFSNRFDDYVNNITSTIDLKGLEIIPTFDRVIVKPFDKNPFQKVTMQGLLYKDLGGKAPEYKSLEDGNIHEEESYIQVGTVVEAGDLCKYLTPGDIVMWRKPSATPIPFYRKGLFLLDERNIMVVINNNVRERFYGR